MTLPTNISTATLDGNGVATEFPFAFPVWADDQLVVYVTDSSGVVTVTENWTVVRTDAGGTITYPEEGGAVLPVGSTLTVQRDMPLTQEVDLVPSTAFSPGVIETALDQQMASIQQLAEAVSRTVKVDPGSETNPDELLQELADDVASAAASAATATTQAGIASASASAAAVSAAALPNAATIGSGKVPQSDGSAWSGVTLGTAALADTGTGEGDVPVLGTGGALTVPGLLTLSGGQIAFPATAVPSVDANTLDDYEEGTWTPVIIGTATEGIGTYTVQGGEYCKIGKTVILQGGLSWSAHTGTGNMVITGLPFGVGSLTAAMAGRVNAFTVTGQVSLYNNGGSETQFQLFAQTNGTSTALAMDTAASIFFQLAYTVA